ncbi:hypothetical protein DDB_G0267742 [Dictyostelium discoideum AX4]|uniref:acylaminoacyl-peptidase n=1 Tax=Dictyostelium discoideum TaxID=44689 RepID=Q55GA9_DICDI|nr:hypothetical protein DDB_G0267742 [Dictyostelium discoideum AX4]EAL73324.1 hypothetical protein DDB_G0267742 [Dictyostelium discoideum AX4]|eukprot:XP_647275.1 hypothetical protein DDB_G0267742 [Dictyostelium discoideum AX4]
MKEIINNFKEIISIPTVVNSNFTGFDEETVNVSIALSQTDFENKKNKLYQIDKSILFQLNGNNIDKVISSPFPIEITTTNISISNSFSKKLIIKEINNTEFEYHFDIITNSNNLITTIKSKDIHRKILNDEWFGGFSWSPCENFIAFIADNKIKNSSGFFEKDLKNKENIGDQYLYKENLGETYSNVHNPTIFIIDLIKESVYPIEPFPIDSIMAGQVIWEPNGNGFLFLGWEIGKRIYGMKLCFSRINSIYYFNFKIFLQIERNNNNNKNSNDKFAYIKNLINSNKKVSFRSLRFSPDGNNLVFIGFDELIHNHNSCSKLFLLPWSKEISLQLGGAGSAGGAGGAGGYSEIEFQTLIDYKFSNDLESFYGIYCMGVPKCTFINNETIIFSNSVGSINKMISFNILTKKLKFIESKGIFESNDQKQQQQLLNYHIYSVMKGMILTRVSSINKPPSIYLLKIDNNLNIIKSIEIYKSPIKNQNLISSEISIHKVPISYNNSSNDNNDYSNIKSFELIYVKNNKNNNSNEDNNNNNNNNSIIKRPTILFIHGGPHMNITIEYTYPFGYLQSLGYNIIIPNYRGSSGCGKDFIDCLPGKIGTLDKEDCLSSLNYSIEFIDKQGIDINRISIIGGSHGGYLATYLSIEPLIKTVILRNPVIDNSFLATLTDIQDWCLFKCGIDKNNLYNSLPTLKELEIMRNCSPSTCFDQIKIPILLLLGEKDKRVYSKSQGLLLYNNLIERNIKTKCLMYLNESHSLDNTIDSKLDQWINIAKWLNENC